MGPFSSPITDLVCGLPSCRRRTWPIMALQAYIDDSHGAGQVLVLAGYISTADKWSDFSDEWGALLTMHPRLTRFKMSEVDLSSELQLERTRHMYRVIERHVLAQVAVAVDCRQLAELVPRMLVQSFLANPYNIAMKAVVNLTAQLQRDIGLHDKIDFVFDSRGEAKRFQSSFDHYVSTLDSEMSTVTGQTPIFRDDESFLPLQAADILAFWVRKLWLKDGNISKKGVEYPWSQTRSIPMLALDLCDDDLKGDLENIQRANIKKVAPMLLPSVTWTVTFRSNLRRGSGGY